MADQLPFQKNEKAENTGGKKKSSKLFSQKSKAPQQDLGKNISFLTNTINDLSRRLRVLEERYNNLQKKTQITEENMLANFRKSNATLSTFHEDINEFKNKVKMNDERSELIIKELKLTAKKEDLDVINRYLEFWEPVKFVTRNEIDKIVKEIVGSLDESESSDDDKEVIEKDFFKI